MLLVLRQTLMLSLIVTETTRLKFCQIKVPWPVDPRNGPQKPTSSSKLVQLGRPRGITRYSASWQASTQGKLRCEPSHHRHEKTLLEQEPVASLRGSAICFASWVKSPSILAPAKVRRDSSIVRVWTGRHALLCWDKMRHKNENVLSPIPWPNLAASTFSTTKTPPGSLVNVI